MLVLRKTLWDAPTTHQVLMATGMLCLGLIQLLGGRYNVESLPLSPVLFNKPVALVICVFAVAGIFTALVSGPEWCYISRIVFCVFNVAHYTAIAYIFGAQLRVGTVIYPIVMVWSVWLLFRAAYDRRILVQILRKKYPSE